MADRESRILKDHNGGLTTGTVSRVVRELHAIERLKKEVKDKEKALKKRAEEDGVNFDTIREAVKVMGRDPEEVAAEHNRMTQYLKLLNTPIGDRLSFIEDAGDPATVTDKDRMRYWRQQGYAAGLRADNRDTCPHDPNSEAGREWMEGWDEGQGKNLEGITDGKGTKATRQPRKPRAAPANDPPAPEPEEPEASSEDEQPPEPEAETPPAPTSDAPPAPPTDDEFDSGGKLQTVVDE